MRLRKYQYHDANGRLLFASMRPQPCGCGNEHHGSGHRGDSRASMRPQPCGCGNVSRLSAVYPITGFNEAAAVRLRKSGDLPTQELLQIVLQ